MDKPDDLVKLTVAVPRSLWRAAKVHAAQEDRDLRDIVIEGIRHVLAEAPPPKFTRGFKQLDPNTVLQPITRKPKR